MEQIYVWLINLGDKITALPWEEILPYALGFLGGLIAMCIIDAIGGERPLFEIVSKDKKEEEQ